MEEDNFNSQNAAPPAGDTEEKGGQEGAAADAENNAKLFETKCTYAIFRPDGQISESGQTKIVLQEQQISLAPQSGKALSVNLHDITDSSVADYKIMFYLATGAGVELSQLGYDFESFAKAFNKARNTILAEELMMQEPTDKGKAECQVRRDGKDLGLCQIQFYEASLLVAPEHEPLFKVYYGDIDNFNVQDYVISLLLGNSKVEFSQLGEKLDYVSKIITEGLNALSLNMQQQVKEMILGLDPLVARSLADLMRDGRAIAKGQVETVAPKAWEELEKFLASSGIKEEYDYLKGLANGQETYIGIKRTMIGSLAGQYVWFLVPLLENNAIALEAVSQEGAGRATYFFRLVGRSEFAGKKESLPALAKDLAGSINNCLRAINFRREPIYLPEEKLKEPKYWKYRFAISNHPELKILRALFIGRVMHRSDEGWRQSVEELLKFNLGEKDDAKQWKASDDTLEPESEPQENNPKQEDEKQ